jgi:hypothetical protein
MADDTTPTESPEGGIADWWRRLNLAYRVAIIGAVVSGLLGAGGSIVAALISSSASTPETFREIPETPTGDDSVAGRSTPTSVSWLPSSSPDASGPCISPTTPRTIVPLTLVGSSAGAGATNHDPPLSYTLYEAGGRYGRFFFPLTVDPCSISSGVDWGGIEATVAVAHGGVPAQVDHRRLVLRGTAVNVVHIESITVTVVNRGPAPTGWHNEVVGCGGVIVPWRVQVNLDTDPPTEKWFREDVAVSRPSLTVKVDEEEVVDISVSVTNYAIEWVIDIVYSSAVGSGQLRIDDGGRPFRLVGTKNSQPYKASGDGGLVPGRGC